MNEITSTCQSHIYSVAGLGYELSKYLALLGARVIIACDSPSKAEAVSHTHTIDVHHISFVKFQTFGLDRIVIYYRIATHGELTIHLL